MGHPITRHGEPAAVEEPAGVEVEPAVVEEPAGVEVEPAVVEDEPVGFEGEPAVVEDDGEDDATALISEDARFVPFLSVSSLRVKGRPK